MIISSFFTNNGNPVTGLTPTIRIWEVTPTLDTLVVTDAPMGEIGDGFYKYDFVSYDPTKDYTFRSDGGVTLPAVNRYLVGANNAASITTQTLTEIGAQVWDTNANSHLIPGSTGEKLSQIKADTTTLVVSTSAINALVQLVLKYDTNRTKIDTVAKTLTVYDDDCVTPLEVFNLFDSNGVPSVTEVCERRPTTCP